MRKFIAGWLVGVITATALTVGAAEQMLRLVVDGREIYFPEAPPQILNNRTMVPARPLAEALGANVAWDGQNRTVVITTAKTQMPPTDNTTVEYEHTRALAIKYGWLGSQAADSVTLDAKNGNTVTVPLPTPAEFTVTSSNGTTVRGMGKSDGIYLNVVDLKAAGLTD